MRSVMQLLLAALMLHAASAAPVPAGRELQDAAAAPTKPAWSIWSSAKHFFKIQSNINNKKVPGRLPGETPSPPMPTSFGVEFKHVREYYCKKAGNADKPLCAQPITPTSVKPKFNEMRDAFKSYCADAANQKDIKACNGAKSTFGFPSASPQVKAMMQTTAKAPKAPKAAAAKPAGAAKAAKKASKAKAKPDTSS